MLQPVVGFLSFVFCHVVVFMMRNPMIGNVLPSLAVRASVVVNFVLFCSRLSKIGWTLTTKLSVSQVITHLKSILEVETIFLKGRVVAERHGT